MDNLYTGNMCIKSERIRSSVLKKRCSFLMYKVMRGDQTLCATVTDVLVGTMIRNVCSVADVLLPLRT
jgi:hypothetical protein